MELRRQWSQGQMAQAGLFLAVSTLALTASFLGVVALLTGGVTGLERRLPVYVLAMAVAFVAAIVVLETEYVDGTRILKVAGGGGVATLVLVTLGGEGVAYVVQRPNQVLSSQLLFYILAAGLIGTGLGYWVINHWGDVRRRHAEL